jgi:Domain of unknown function (DUF5009)
VVWIALRRFLLLAFFALFTQHMKAWTLAAQPAVADQLLSLLAFVLVFFQLYEHQQPKGKRLLLVLKIISFAVALFLVWKLPFRSGKGFDFYQSDIIIIVLANMALFGMLIYYLTANKPLLRIGILPFIMAIFLAAKEPGNGWAKELFQFNHIGDFKFDWLYKFYFLKYLFIVIPGTIAGEWMLDAMKQHKTTAAKQLSANRNTENTLSFIALLLICLNVYGLFTRLLVFNVITTALLCGWALYLVKKTETGSLFKNLVLAGSYLLLLGLFFEAYEGGIRKDSSTYSYYFVTSGLAFFALVFFSVTAKRKYLSAISNILAINGKHPMVAYIAGSLLLLPLMSITHTKSFWDAMNSGAFMGFMKGLVFTGIVSLITIFFVKRKWFWKT